MKRQTLISISIICSILFAFGFLFGYILRQTNSAALAHNSLQASQQVANSQTPVPTEVLPPKSDLQQQPTTPRNNVVNPNPSPPSVEQLRKGLETVKWGFTSRKPTDIADTIITQEKAIELVQKRYDVQPLSTTPFLGFLQNQGLQKPIDIRDTNGSPFAEPRLVWIVTLSGVQQTSSGPPNQEKKISNELNVILDAKTGEYLADFVWTR